MRSRPLSLLCLASRLGRLAWPLGLALGWGLLLWVALAALAPALASAPAQAASAPPQPRASIHRAALAAMPPAALNVLLQSQLGGDVTAVVVSGTYAYVGVGPCLVVLDISQPATPILVGKTPPLPDVIQAVAVAGSYAYVADYDGGLRVINIATPTTPLEVGFYDTSNLAFDVAVAGSYAYVADNDAGLRVINVATPAAPVEVGFYDTAGLAVGVAVSGAYAYVADGNLGLRVINVATPAAPTEVGFYDTPSYAFKVAVSGTYAYVADNTSGLRVVNIATPTAPAEVGFYDTAGFAYAVTLSGTYAYVADGFSGLRIVNIATPAAPTSVGVYVLPGSAEATALRGPYAYVADSSRSLRVLNVAVPATPVEVGAYSAPGSPNDVAVAGNYAYVADNDGSLRVVRLTPANAPAEVALVETPGNSYAVVVSGSYAYLADGGWGLRVVSVATPTAPVEVGFYDTSGSAKGVAISGSYVYVADGTAGLRVVSVATPTAPVAVGFYDTPDYAEGVAISGTYAYVADGNSGLRVINIATPTAPVEVGFYDTPGYAYGVAISGSYAYVADGGSGLRVVSVATPTAPTNVGVYDTPGVANAVALEGNYAYVADGSEGLQVVSIATPAAPTSVGFYDVPHIAYGVAVTGQVAYVASYASGLYALQYVGPATCFTEYTGDGLTDFASLDASAVQSAVGAVAPTGVVKIAGTCAGVQTLLGTTQTVAITKTLTLAGGYTTTNWLQAYPLTQPTTLDAVGAGRVINTNAALTVRDLTVQNGRLTVNGQLGAGIYAGPTITLSNVTVYNNRASGGVDSAGAGLYTQNDAYLIGSTFISNSAIGGGGGAWVSMVGYVTGTTFMSNTANDGGGAWFWNRAYLTNTAFLSNSAFNIGGGAYFELASSITDSVFQNNTATEGGGAGPYGPLFITNTRFIANWASYGGGLHFSNADGSQLVNVLFSRNHGQNQGAAAYVLAAASPLHILHSTIASPTVATGQQAVAVLAGTVYLTNTVIASYTTGLANVGTGVVRENYNLFSNVPTRYAGGVVGGANSFSGTANFYNTTNYTLSAVSLAINRGTNAGVTSDYFGDPRPQAGGFDIGYDEAPFAAPLWLTPTAGANGAINPGTPQLVVAGSTFTFSIVPNVNYRIADVWVDGATVGTPSVYTFTNIAANHTLTAAFVLDTYTLTVATAGTGSGVVTPTTGVYTHPYGTLVTLTASPNVGSTFTSWSGNCSGIGSCVVTMTATRSVTATFTLNTYTLTVSTAGTGSGVVTPTAGIYTHPHGTLVTLTAAPNVGSTFAGWSGNCSGTGNCNVTMTTTRRVTATFTLNTYTITPTAGANGSILPAVPQNVAYGSTRTFTITPNFGYHTADVGVDGVSLGPIPNYSFPNISANHTITAAFALNTYTLTLAAAPTHLFANGLDESILTVTLTSDPGVVLAGKLVTLTAPLGSVANPVLVLGSGGVGTTTYTVGIVPGSTPLTATFRELASLSVTTTVVTLKPNPIIGSLNAQFGGQIITYTFAVTNVVATTQTVAMSGSVPLGANLIAVTGGVSVTTGGDYGAGYAEATNLVLAPNASHTLRWTVQFIGFTGNVVTQGHAESAQARLRLPAALQIYRQLFMPVYGRP